MVDEEGTGPDDSSIKPVSSLRSKFENLGHERRPSHTASTVRSPQPSQPPNARTPGPIRVSVDIPRSSNQVSSGLGITNGSVAESRPNVARQPRPLSIGQLPARQSSPPRITVGSPESTSTGHHIRSASQSPTRPSSRMQQHAYDTIQAVSPKSSVHTFQPPVPIRTPTFVAGPSTENLHAPIVSPRVQRSPKFGASGPPPVNRAGKPSITSPLVGSTPHAEPSSLDLKSDTAVSPFNTPPSSTETTPFEVGSGLRPDGQTRLPSNTSAFGPRSYFVPLAKSEGPAQQRQSDSPPLPTADKPPALPFRTSRDETYSNEVGREKRTPSTHSMRQIHSGRTSPSKMHKIPARTAPEDAPLSSEPALSQPGKIARRANGSITVADRLQPEAAVAASKPAPPAVPAPRRSIDTRRSLDIRPSLDRQERILEAEGASGPRADDYEDIPSAGTTGLSEFPDASQANRRPPRFQHRPWEFGVGYDTRLFTCCGEYICTGGMNTRVWSLKTGESLTTLSLGENVKVTAMAWIPSKDPLQDGKQLWLGTNLGHIHQLDVPSRQIVHTRPAAHARGEIVKIFRHASALWSLGSDGQLLNWKNDSDNGVASLDVKPQVFHIARGHSASIVVENSFWVACGKSIYIYNLVATSDNRFAELARPLSQENTGDITCAARVSSQPNAVYFGHTDGKVTVYNKKDHSLIGVFNVSQYRISAMTGVGNLLWAGYSTGMVFVYDTSTSPWTVRKDWRAHQEPISDIIADQSSIWKLDRFNAITLGMDNVLRIWDGMLEQDWLEDRMQQRDEEFCDFQEVTASILTWNAGASKPTALRATQSDDTFFRDYLRSQPAADILVFGFQELVDLEDKKVTAKSFFKSKKKDPSDHEKMSHQYRAWRDHLVRCLDDLMPASSSYTLLQTANLVGLFSCVFVKTSLRPRIKQFSGAEVKRGMGGLHGNKGALILRMILDDTSICLVNCHLAAGQSQTMHRNNDVTAIMESENLPPTVGSSNIFVGGGDGSMILDHEICIFNGDLNYRIDAMTRDAVVRAVERNDLARLLERDQLLLSKKRNPAFRLRLFQEMPITFAPTYKYDVGTTRYDTSDKKRSPAWCDRVLFRGLGRIKCTEYRRWEVHTSDHRPVSAHFKMRVKSIDPARQQVVRQKTGVELDQFCRKVKYNVKLDYLMNVLGISQKEAVDSLGPR